MSNLHRDLAPISSAAWAEIEEEASRSFKRNVAGRRLVDVKGPLGLDTDSVTIGHRTKIDSPADGISAYLRNAQPLVELKVPFTVTREAIDDVERGAADSDWDPVVKAARELALAEDRAIFSGYGAANITGLGEGATNIALPDDVRESTDAISQAMNKLRLASVDGPYSLALSADLYAQVNETSNHGYPVREHLRRILTDGEIVWAPAIDGAYLVSTRGGDFELTIGQDVSIGYDSHDADVVNLYFTESFTYLTYTPEAAVALR
ncbi:bacteriocin family protein [Gordonia sp. HY002]|uniref:family 1 encapsulin nanocompartment shell protein n=1 Tax=Gordonia zhenghanii TaxID=2911516 RepID=UPI001EF06D10|nr:family 1 encapsulin nanocompartment shell protein [Gordonia zhenghanii]MCF8572211.1 bacteriocin family protein [Gordonia zhenghanii]MCF8607208.1 bacteriocin family protein [Gordonia zhenghanii]